MSTPVHSMAFFDMLAELFNDQTFRDVYRVVVVAELGQPLAITIERWGDQAVVDGFRMFDVEALKASIADDNANPDRA